MLFELLLFAGGCQNGACRIERPLIERRVEKTTVVKVDKEVVKERKVRKFLKRRR